MLRVAVRRPREFRVAGWVRLRPGDDRLGEAVRPPVEADRFAEPERVEADRFAEPEREGLDRFTEEPLLADRLPPERPRWAKAAA